MLSEEEIKFHVQDNLSYVKMYTDTQTQTHTHTHTHTPQNGKQ